MLVFIGSRIIYYRTSCRLIRIRLVSQLTAFQEFSKNYLDTLINNIFVPPSPVLPAIFVSSLNEALLSAGKAAISPYHLKIVHLSNIAINF